MTGREISRVHHCPMDLHETIRAKDREIEELRRMLRILEPSSSRKIQVSKLLSFQKQGSLCLAFSPTIRFGPVNGSRVSSSSMAYAKPKRVGRWMINNSAGIVSVFIASKEWFSSSLGGAALFHADICSLSFCM